MSSPSPSSRPREGGGGIRCIRAFVALELSGSVREALARVQAELRQELDGVRWVAPERMHLTLKFLGELDPGRLEHLERALRKVAAARFTLAVAGLGAFPPRGKVRVLWAGCYEESGRLEELARAIEARARRIRVPKERRPFRAHLTLGRFRIPAAGERVRERLAARTEEVLGSFEVGEFVLFRSELGPGGPTYTALERYPLREPE